MTATEPTMPIPADGSDDTRRLILLGGLSAIVVLLAVAAIARRPRSAPIAVPASQLAGDAALDWESSLQHLAGAWNLRYEGVEDRLNALESASAVAHAQPPAVVVSGEAEPPAPPTPAAVSVPGLANGAPSSTSSPIRSIDEGARSTR